MTTSPIARYLLLLAVSAMTTFILMPFAHILGRRMRAWDAPDELSHDEHVFHIVRTGGIGIVGGLYVGMLVSLVIRPEIFATRDMAGMMLGGFAIFVVGLLDDLREIAPWLKAVLLLAAILVAVMMMTAVSLTGFERLDFLLAVLILMGGANAFNLMDGLDGLAAGLAIVTSVGLMALSLRLQTPEAGCIKMVVAGAALGFLFDNRPPARIFMGDCGSLVLGFHITGMALHIARKGPAAFVPVLLVLSPFVLDTGLAIARRLLSRQDIFTGDRRHMYDLLNGTIRRVWHVDWVMWVLGLGFAALGFVATYVPVYIQLALLAVSWLIVLLWMIRLGMFRPEQPMATTNGKKGHATSRMNEPLRE